MNKTKPEEIMDTIAWKRTLLLMKEWEDGESFEFPDNDDLSNVDKLLKLSHHYEIEARKTAENMPQYECSIVCMNLYSYIVYIAKCELINNTIHNKDALHIYSLEAIRLLQYGSHMENDENDYSSKQMLLLLRQIEIMILIREIAKRLNAGLISKPNEIAFRNGICLSREDTSFINQFGENFNGKGTRLRVSNDTTHFLMESYYNRTAFLRLLKNLLSGTYDGKGFKIVKGTYFEFLPMMKNDNIEFESYAKFLNGIIRRFEFTIGFLKEQENKRFGMYNADIINTKEIPDEMIYISHIKRWKIEYEEKIDLLETPIVKINKNRYATCFAICGDSINYWVEHELKINIDTCKWKQEFLHKIELQFEEEVNQFLRENGYCAGNLKQNGEWILKSNGQHSKKLPIKLSGECDVLAVNEKSKRIFLIECKRLHDAVSSGYSLKTMENIRKKILQLFIPKLSTKKNEIKGYLQKTYPDFELCSAIVTDVDFAIYIPKDAEYKWGDEVLYSCFDSLKKAIKTNSSLKSAIFIRNNIE